MSLAAKLTSWEPYALAILRIVVALLFLTHAIVKLTGFPPGAMPGSQPLVSLLGAAMVIELITGTLVLVGWFTRTSAFVASGEMAVAYWTYHIQMNWHPLLNGGEPAILFCFIFLYLVFSGPGALSIDGRATHIEVTDAQRL